MASIEASAATDRVAPYSTPPPVRNRIVLCPYTNVFAYNTTSRRVSLNN